MSSQKQICPDCSSTETTKKGFGLVKPGTRKQRYKCKRCARTFYGGNRSVLKSETGRIKGKMIMRKKMMAIATLLLMISFLVVPVSALQIDMKGIGYAEVETHLTGGGSTLDDRVEINAWYYVMEMEIGTGSYEITRSVYIPRTTYDPYYNRDYLKGKTSQILFSTTYEGSEELTAEALLQITGTSHDYSGGSLSQTLTAGASMLTEFIVDVSTAYREFYVTFSGTTDEDYDFHYDAYHYGGSGRFLDVVQMSASDPTLDFSGFGAGGDFGLYASADFGLSVLGTVAGSESSSNPARSTREYGQIGYFEPADGYVGTELSVTGNLIDIDITGMYNSNSDTSTRERYPKLEDMFGFTIGPAP